MFCPKCGVQNPETGRFCRSCGTDLGTVSQALTGSLPQARPLVDHKGRPISLDRAIAKMFTGLAFVAVAIALLLTGKGQGWWFWLLIPAFTSIGAGLAQYIQLRNADNRRLSASSAAVSVTEFPPSPANILQPSQTEYISPDSKYRTGDLVPPSVTESTTRHLQIDPEDKTMTLPKK
jgi:hypothetical protein